MVKVCFNLFADIVKRQDLANKGRLSLHKLTNRTNTNVLETSQEIPDSSVLESKALVRKNKKNPQGLKCWLFRKNHRSKDCKVFLKKSVKHRIQYIKEQKHIVKECKSNFSCSKDSCKKRHHTLQRQI